MEKERFTAKFSQSLETRNRLEALFVGLLGLGYLHTDSDFQTLLDSQEAILQNALDIARNDFDLCRNSRNSASIAYRSAKGKEKQVLKACLEREESILAKANHRLNMTTYAKENNYFVRTLVEDLATTQSWYENPTTYGVALRQSGHFLRNAKINTWNSLAKLLNQEAFVTQDDLANLHTWVIEKSMAYSAGFVARQASENDSVLHGATEDQLAWIATTMAQKLGQARPQYQQKFAERKYDSIYDCTWDHDSTFLKSAQESWLPWLAGQEFSQYNYERTWVEAQLIGLPGELHDQTKQAILSVVDSLKDMVRYWYSFTLPINFVLADIICWLENEKSNLKTAYAEKIAKEAAIEAQKPLTIAKELLTYNPPRIPTNYYWANDSKILKAKGKGLLSSCDEYITDGHVMIATKFFAHKDYQKLCDIAILPTTDAKELGTATRPNANMLLKNLANKAQESVTCLGTRVIPSSDKEKHEFYRHYTYFASDSGQVITVQAGYWQLLQRLGVMKAQARIMLVDLTVVVYAHNGDILACIMPCRIDAKELTTVELYNQAKEASRVKAA